MNFFAKGKGIDDLFFYGFTGRLFQCPGVVIKLSMITFYKFSAFTDTVCLIIQHNQSVLFFKIHIYDSLNKNKFAFLFFLPQIRCRHSEYEWLLFKKAESKLI